MNLSKSDKYHLFARGQFFIHETDLPKEGHVDKLVDQLFSKQKERPLSLEMTYLTREEFRNASSGTRLKIKAEQRENVRLLSQKWIRQMMSEEAGLLEKMTLFWHGHFACRTLDNARTALDLNNRLRKHALGGFKALVMAVSTSAAMNSYLHLKQNKKGSPNEDFARELCELFLLGRDVDYTEKDVKEIARAFTGWTVDWDGNFSVNSRKHDEGMKTIFGKTENFGGEEVIDMILANKNCARFIAGKMYAFFVRETINDAHVEELANVFYASDYSIEQVMKHMFKAEWFYEAKGELIKSPLELIVSMGKAFDLKYEDSATLVRVQSYLGQVLFNPPNVAGWKGGRNWIDASRLAFRLRMGSMILTEGVVAMDETSPALDEMAEKRKKKKKKLKLNEEIDWNAFWKKNENFAEALIRSGNQDLIDANQKQENYRVVQLISTPDFQLT